MKGKLLLRIDRPKNWKFAQAPRLFWGQVQRVVAVQPTWYSYIVGNRHNIECALELTGYPLSPILELH